MKPSDPRGSAEGDDAQNAADAPRKPYSRPTLTVYGDVREITNMVGMTGQFDGFGGGWFMWRVKT